MRPQVFNVELILVSTILTDCYGLGLEGLVTTLRTEAVTALASLTPHVSPGSAASQLRVVTSDGVRSERRLAAGQSDKLLCQPPTNLQ